MREILSITSIVVASVSLAFRKLVLETLATDIEALG
jgi:hypothetical protein